jgi:hypothetical protein
MVACVCFFVFVVFSSGFGSEIQLKKSGLGSGRLPVSSTECFGQFLSFVSLGFRSQIYAHPSTSARHAPPSCVPRRLLPLLSEVSATWFTGALRVVLTRQSVFTLWLCVKATLRRFKPGLTAPGVYGVGSAAGCFRCRHVFYTRRRSDEVSAISPLPASCFGCFSAFVLCYSFVSPVQSVFVLLKFYWNF